MGVQVDFLLMLLNISNTMEELLMKLVMFILQKMELASSLLNIMLLLESLEEQSILQLEMKLNLEMLSILSDLLPLLSKSLETSMLIQLEFMLKKDVVLLLLK